jgi:hypothetical protein
MTTRMHDQCNHFSYNSCPHKDDDIMKMATQDFQKYHGEQMPILSLPFHEEINAICSSCDKFSQVPPKRV